MLLVFLGGMVSTIPGGIADALGELALPHTGDGALASTLDAFLVVGPAEELVKMLAVYLLVYRSADFDEPIDGLVYSGAAALGFASAENIVYLAQYGSSVIHLRAFTAVPGHFLFAGVVGYAMGLKKAGLPASLAAAWLTAAGLHGLYDACLFGSVELDLPLLNLGAIGVLVVCARRYRGYVVHLTELSPFRSGSGHLVCHRCRRVLAPSDRFCDRCGAPMSA